MRNMQIYQKFLSHAIMTFHNMNNILSFKTLMAYGEHTTYHFMQDSYHVQAT